MPPADDGSVFVGLSGITVSIREGARAALLRAGLARECGDFGLLVTTQDGDMPYDPEIGLRLSSADPVLTSNDTREPEAATKSP